MTPNKQLFLHRPNEGIWGDCWRTSIACLLDLRPEDVPHFNEGSIDGLPKPVEQTNADTDRWLHERGYQLITVPLPGETALEDVIRCADAWGRGAHFLLSGFSRTGVNHTVICQGDRIVWDPSRTDAGIVGPMDNNFWFVEWIARVASGKAV